MPFSTRYRPYLPGTGHALPPQYRESAAKYERNEVFRPPVDKEWSGANPRFSEDLNPFYDYYFSGEDVSIYIDGLFENKYDLDVYYFAYNIKQEKQPLYGFWSNTFDAMLNGTRIIAGTFSVNFRSPRRMTSLLEAAARARELNAKSSDKGYNDRVISPLYNDNDIQLSAEDEANINKYWNRSQLDRITSDPHANKFLPNHHNIFSNHPPFNFIISFGRQDGSLSPYGLACDPTQNISSGYFDKVMTTDHNHRLLKPNSDNLKTILQNVHLLDMSTQYDTSGQPIMETYTFLARDYYFSEVDLYDTIKEAKASPLESETYNGSNSTVTADSVFSEAAQTQATSVRNRQFF